MSLELLKAGNQRFLASSGGDADHLEQIHVTAGGQYPFAIILSCIDSRVPAEIVFDQGIGDIFVARVAGNVVCDDILGSMEFACKIAGSKLIVVLGHSECGAVKGAYSGAELGHLTGLLRKIKPSIDLINEMEPLEHSDVIQQIADANVEHSVREIRRRSEVLDELISNGQVGIVGGMYSVKTGKVDFQELITA